jgi:two-component system response regulator HydG
MLDILVVDDDDIVRRSVSFTLSGAGHRVASAADGERALALARTSSFDVALCDVHLPGIDGLTLLRRLRRAAPDTDVVMMTAFGSVPDAVAAAREGAEYVTKPFDPEDLLEKVLQPIADRREHRRSAATVRASQILATSARARSDVVHSSVMMRRVLERAESAARSDLDVLLTGEPGSGKSLLARTMHAMSPRSDASLVSCAATFAADGSARRNGQGPFEAAEGGTLVLDGVNHLPLDRQALLLRAIDSVSSSSPFGHARILSLSSADLRAEVAAGRFLAPLHLRLAPVEIDLPPLRQRAGDLYVLTNHFLRELGPRGRVTPSLTSAAWRALHDHPFPGNVRELKQVIEAAVAVSKGGTIGVEHLPAGMGAA